MQAKKIIVRAGNAKYPFIVGINLERELLRAVKEAGVPRVALITDSTVKKLWSAQLMRVLKKSGKSVELISFSAGERNKNQKTVTALHHELLKRQFGRDSLIIAVGGGVVGDLVGFVAATYMRGIPYIQVPTTLLAMVDSSTGGKVGIDTPYGKNTVGAFWHPKAVIADLQFLKALPRTQLISGLMEAVKEFFTFNKGLLGLAEKLDLDNPLRTAKILQEVVYKSVQFKASVVAADEREGNKRQILNFGHTIGHAVEHLSGYRIPHGFAVGYGMLAEAKVAQLLRILPEREFESLQKYLAALGIHAGALKRFSIPAIVRTTKSDKKTRAGVAHYVLLTRRGAIYTHGGRYAHPVSDAVITTALLALRNS